MIPNDTQRAIIREAILRGAYLLDVRRPDEYQMGHIPGSTNIPLDELMAQIDLLEVEDQEAEIVVYCTAGIRSEMAMRLLESRGLRVLDAGSWLIVRELIDSL